MPVSRDEDVSRKLSHRNLVWSLLQLDDLLVDKLGFFVYDEVRVKWTRLGGIVPLPFSATAAWKSYARETAIYANGGCIAAVSALQVKLCSFGGHDRGTDYNAWYPDKPRDCKGVEIANRNILGIRMQEKLMWGYVDFEIVGKDNPLGTSSQGALELQESRNC